MNKVLSRLALCLFCFLIPIHDAAAAPALTAEAAILMDYQSGEILYCKNAYESRPPASLTKVMTTILAIEHQPDLSYTATVSPAAAATGESRLNLQTGEQITLENLLYGALLKSGNDACVAIAENVAPDEEDFVWRMNLKAQLLGCVSTTFQNTNGLPDDQHKSCAYDLAVIARYALQNDTFSQIVQTRYATVHWVGQRQCQIKNTNRLLQFYPGAIGVKTGTTNAAGQCLIAAAKRGDHCLIAVVLKSQNRFLDAANLLDYGFKTIGCQ